VESERVRQTDDGPWREQNVEDSDGERSVLWSRYRIGGRVFASAWRSQLAYGIAAMGSPPLSSLIALRSACEPDCETARLRLQAVARSLEPRLRLMHDGTPK
jgi:hypothetical protein